MARCHQRRLAAHTVLLGDKDKTTKSTSPLVSYNSTHLTDIVEPGGGPGGSDRLFEAKVVSPCTLAERQGAELRGQKPPKRGYLFGFGNTEESYRIMIYGSATRGLPTDGLFDEDTGQGFVPRRLGHYSDALARGKKVIALIAEVFGGLSPHPARFLRQLARVAAKHTTRDSTIRPLRPLVPAAPRAAHLARRRHDGRPQRPRGHPEAQEAGSAAPRGLDARRRPIGPRPHGALTLCVPLGFVLRV